MNLTADDPIETERRAHEEFARTHAAPEYRGLLAHQYAQWHEYNTTFFGGKLKVPHIGIGRTHARRFSECRLTTNYGGAMDITLAERVAFGPPDRVVREPWPAEGAGRFLDDLLLGETVKQFVLEIHGNTEDGYGGYGPRFAAEATRIGPLVGLPAGEVMARRRSHLGRGGPVAAFWPWAYRDPGYYLGHIDLAHLAVGGLRTSPGDDRAVPPGVYEYLLYLARTNQIVRLTDVLGRRVDANLEKMAPAVAAFERSPHDPSGMPLPDPAVEAGWLAWNDGCVRVMAGGILARRAFDVMPVLADALQDAGCEDEVLLGHCRANSRHTANCWALRVLTAAPAA